MRQVPWTRRRIARKMPRRLPTITIMDIGGWLRILGLEQYEAAFQANAVNAEVLRDLTDQDLKKLGVRLGHRPKLLRAR